MMKRDLFAIEKATLEKIRNSYPHLFTEPAFVDDQTFLARFGINIPKPRYCPQAYLKLYPHDFIVEEIDNEGVLHTINYETMDARGLPSSTNWSATLVKCGITTIEAIREIAEQLNVPQDRVTFSGIKDKQAITAQRIAFRAVSFEELEKIKSSSFFLKNIKPFTSVLAQGSLLENRFTIRLRFADHPTLQTQNSITDAIANISAYGYFNFFYLQRFGVPRFLAHTWGKYIVKNDIPDLIHSVLFEKSDNELAFWSELRNHALSVQDNKKDIKNLYQPFSVYLGQENALLDALEKYPDNPRLFLAEIKSYAQIWVSAYISILWNEQLSKSILENNIPMTIPLSRPDLRNFPFINTTNKHIETMLPVKNLSLSWKKSHADISFILAKGSYATCLLSHIVDIVSGTPPTGISTDLLLDEASKEHAETLNLFKNQIQNSNIRNIE